MAGGCAAGGFAAGMDMVWLKVAVANRSVAAVGRRTMLRCIRGSWTLRFEDNFLIQNLKAEGKVGK
jgi:hypothetical protein